MPTAIHAYFNTCCSDPGVCNKIELTQESLRHAKTRPDQVIYKCAKCKSIKPERAHHCSVCGRCVMKMDHHCVRVCHLVSNFKMHFSVFWKFCHPNGNYLQTFIVKMWKNSSSTVAVLGNLETIVLQWIDVTKVKNEMKLYYKLQSGFYCDLFLDFWSNLAVKMSFS